MDENFPTKTVARTLGIFLCYRLIIPTDWLVYTQYEESHCEQQRVNIEKRSNYDDLSVF